MPGSCFSPVLFVFLSMAGDDIAADVCWRGARQESQARCGFAAFHACQNPLIRALFFQGMRDFFRSGCFLCYDQLFSIGKGLNPVTEGMPFGKLMVFSGVIDVN